MFEISKMKLILFTLFFTTINACHYYRFKGFGDFDGHNYMKVFNSEHIRLVYRDKTLKEDPECNWVLTSRLYEFPRYTSLTCVGEYDFGQLNWRMEDGNSSNYVDADITCSNYGGVPFPVRVFLLFVLIVACLAWGNILYTMNHPLRRVSET